MGRCSQAFPASPSKAAWAETREALAASLVPCVAPISQGTLDTRYPGHPSLAATAVLFGSIAFDSFQNEILQDCCFVKTWSLGIFLAILGEKSLEVLRMEFMKLRHVVPAHPRT